MLIHMPALEPQSSVRPGDILSSPTVPTTPRQTHLISQDPEEPPLYASLGQDDNRGPSFQAHKAAFFFKPERELEKVRPCRPIAYGTRPRTSRPRLS